MAAQRDDVLGPARATDNRRWRGGRGRVREAGRAELERLRREIGEKNKRIRELEMERDVFKRCMALWVK
ncbi:hypothetical protein [Streptomyces sp. SID14515]|uniref:hypothetical protein n=1 Tax=Streptomyces sp. SID14515 TaxID=2706074 RepID=UPI0031B9F8E6